MATSAALERGATLGRHEVVKAWASDALHSPPMKKAGSLAAPGFSFPWFSCARYRIVSSSARAWVCAR
jgi:hypothetical protein